LKLVNGFLRNRVVNHGQALPLAIAGVNMRLDAKGLVAFDAANGADRTKAVARTIGVSSELLDDSDRDRFAELGIFPEDAHTSSTLSSKPANGGTRSKWCGNLASASWAQSARPLQKLCRM
jgi:hypothetical protein